MHLMIVPIVSNIFGKHEDKAEMEEAESTAKSFGPTSTLCYLGSSCSLTLAFLFKGSSAFPGVVSVQVSWEVVEGGGWQNVEDYCRVRWRNGCRGGTAFVST